MDPPPGKLRVDRRALLDCPRDQVRRGVGVRAVVYDRYGPPDVLRVEDVPVPSPAAGQVLVSAGKVVAFIPNEVGKALFQHSRRGDPAS